MCAVFTLPNQENSILRGDFGWCLSPKREVKSFSYFVVFHRINLTLGGMIASKLIHFKKYSKIKIKKTVNLSQSPLI